MNSTNPYRLVAVGLSFFHEIQNSYSSQCSLANIMPIKKN